MRDKATQSSDLLKDRKRAQAAASRRPEEAPPAQNYPKGIGQFIMRNLLYILSAIAVVAVAVLILVIVAPLSNKEAHETTAEEPFVSPYDWTKLNRSEGRYQYVVDGQVKSRLGIDVSDSQQSIDWYAVAADGIDFAMIRLGYRGATEGALYEDEQFENNIAGATDAGLDCGVYFFSQATSEAEAVEEAEFVLNSLSGRQLQYPVAFDSEKHVPGVSDPRTTDLTSDEMTVIAEAFCKKIEGAGYRTIAYGNAADLSRYKREYIEANPIWWAEYNTSVPTANIDLVIWQYSNEGKVDGISNYVDMNIDLTNVFSQ